MLNAVLIAALSFLVLLAFATTWRVVTGPTIPDRLLAGDLTVAILTFVLAIAAILGGSELYLDAALVAAFLAFTSTIVLTQFIAGGKVFDA
ncbi:MAG TPA: monovalent cation/H+ antiporter complex subunit F [Pantanalinema sp.]